MEVKIGLSKKTLDEIISSLEGVLANSYALYLKTQNFHWNVTGETFFSLHLLFEKHYVELSKNIDEIAERIVTLGKPVNATFSQFLKKSILKEAKLPLSGHQMIRELLNDHEAVSQSVRKLISRFQELHDDASSDLMIGQLTFHEKAAWMLRSHLEK